METRPAIRNVRHESDPVTWIVNYESKKYKIDSKVSGTFSLRIKEIERIIIRSPWGRESLLRQRKKNAEVAFVYEIPPTFLEDNKTFKRFVGNVLSKEGIDSWIQQRLVPKISKDAITTNRLCGGEGKGFIVEVEVELVEETLMDNWLGVDENDPECRRPIEQRCIICLEELSSSMIVFTRGYAASIHVHLVAAKSTILDRGENLPIMLFLLYFVKK
ncbi:unnamed protein product [Arabis nemorensis]|uniref:Uncharacterized protein n=1 Tax=Arabis nemorensis TaxID=586526 RepID=A0A565AVF0_9BRAS|nr:unnamed protein product [Arabis nemorensis]